MYVVKTEVYNEGVKYTDAFFVATKYCMFQRDAKTCGLRVSAEIKYIKSINGIIKGRKRWALHSDCFARGDR